MSDGRNFNTALTERSKDEWLTPPVIISALGPFDLDPCAPANDRRPWPTASRHISLPTDGLAAHPSGGIALIFARTETLGFHQEVWEKADAVLFLKGRLRFFHIDGGVTNTANAPSCLVAYGEEATQRLLKASRGTMVRGRFINLKQQKENASHGL